MSYLKQVKKMYAGRDAATSLLYSKLKEAGAVEEVFEFFGCAYSKKNKIGYFVTNKEKEFFDFIGQCEQKGIYCTSGIKQHYRCKATNNELQNMKSNYKMDTLKKVQESYSGNFFQIMSQLINIPARNYAEKLFQEWKLELDGCMNEDRLSLFETTLSMAISMKLLDYTVGKTISGWVQQKKKQFEDNLLIKKGEKHLYAGLVYLECERGVKNYALYPQYDRAWQARQKLLKEAFIVSPIFTKEVYFNPTNFTVIEEKKQQFHNLLVSIMDNSYVSLIKQIYDLPQIVSKEYYENLYKQMNSFATQREIDDFLLFGSQLRLIRGD
ncbi:MAG: hypothetical protein ACRKFN_09930 [Desulfitobacterium sp.]